MASIQFCPNCNNMYYIAIAPSATLDAQPTLIYYCKNCGTEDRNVSNRVVLSKTNKGGSQDFSAFVNKYTKLDPTLQRVSGITCANAECSTRRGRNEEEHKGSDSSNGQEIILMRSVRNFLLG